MAKQKKSSTVKKTNISGHIQNAGLVLEQPIVDTLKTNYMPYAMSVIISRAIPEIDGFKPAHRKILYTMYKMGLLSGGRMKSSNIVGQTMRLNPHGDASIYEAMVRMSRGYGALLTPFIDSKGNFGKAYSRDMAYAASRYTEAKLDSICKEVFSDIDKDTVDFVDNYDSTTTEPVLLPISFPNILANTNTGIAVGMASNICSFNLGELCDATIALIKDENADIFSILEAPDFPCGGLILYDRAELENIYKTGRGSVRVRAKYTYDSTANCIDIFELPPTTTVEMAVDKLIELVKENKIREISDVRDETDLSGLKLTIDLKRGTDPHRLMSKLYKLTSLEAPFSCNFNVLINGTPKVLGVYSILHEWIGFRRECTLRAVGFDLKRKKERLHLLNGLSKILLDIDRAISIIRETEQEADVVPNLMIGFGIDKQQAEYVAELKLRQLNREHILKRTEDIAQLEKDIAELLATLDSTARIDALIVKDLQRVKANHATARRSEILYEYAESIEDDEGHIPDYPVKIFFTRDGYFKKITPQSWRLSSEHKLKDGDELLYEIDSVNSAHILFFTTLGQVYKCRANEFDDTKASLLGEYVPSKLGFEAGELPVFILVTTDYAGEIIFGFNNGKIAKVALSSYATVTQRRKLLKAYSLKAPLVRAMHIASDIDLLLSASSGKQLIINSAMLSVKTTKDTQGVQCIALKNGEVVTEISSYVAGSMQNEHRLRTKNIPAAGCIGESSAEQLHL